MIPSKIEWTDYVWNPVTGCNHGCEYCFARPMSHQKKSHPNPKVSHKYRNEFEPTFHPQEFKKDKLPASVKTGKRVFIGSMTDLFGEWALDEWIAAVFKACEDASQHTYYFLTKNPDRYLKHTPRFGRMNWCFGASATNNDEYVKALRALIEGTSRPAQPIFISLEPMMGPIKSTVPLVLAYQPDWLIVGAETKNGRPVNMPKREWILDLREQCRRNKIPLFEKNSLSKLHLPGGLIQQWPKEGDRPKATG